MVPQTLPYGSWPSPIAAADVAVSSPRIDGARFLGEDVWWSEGVPASARHRRYWRASYGPAEPAWSSSFRLVDARSRVHEYGGGAWTSTGPDHLVFVEHSDQRVWMLRIGDTPEPLTPAGAGMRFADLTVADGRLSRCARRTWTAERPSATS